MSVFADTSGLYALLVESEEDHPGTTRSFRDVLQNRRRLLTTSYVIIETTALLQHRFGIDSAREFLQKIVPAISVKWVDQGLHQKGVDRLLRESRRQLSLVDCVSLEFMRQAGIQDVLALDPHFREAGYRLLPPSPA